MATEYKRIHNETDVSNAAWVSTASDTGLMSVQVVTPGCSTDTENCQARPARNLTLSIASADKLGLMFACGGLFALDGLGLLPRIQVMSASGTGNILVACMLEAIYDITRSRPDYASLSKHLPQLYKLVFSFCENNEELNAWWPRVCHPGMWLAPWQPAFAEDLRQRLPYLDLQSIDSISKVKALLSEETDSSLPVLLCNCTRTDSDKLVVLTNDIRAPTARDMHQQFAHVRIHTDALGTKTDFAAVAAAISLPHCLSGSAKVEVVLIEPLDPNDVQHTEQKSESEEAGLMMNTSGAAYQEMKTVPFEELTAAATDDNNNNNQQQLQLQPHENETPAGAPPLQPAKRSAISTCLRNCMLLDPFGIQSCATYFTKMKLKHPDNNSDKLILLDGFTNSATFRSMLPIDQRSRMRAELSELQSAADLHSDKLCAYRKQIVQCHNQSYASTQQMTYTHRLLNTLSGHFNAGPESKANEALLSGRWSGLPRSICDLAFRWGYMQTWIAFGEGAKSATRPQTLTNGLASPLTGAQLPPVLSGQAVVNCLKSVESELNFDRM